MSLGPRPLWPVATGFVLLFGLLLLPLPLKGELPGNCDTWLNGLALPNHMLNRIAATFGGPDAGTSLYPAASVFGFGESAIGTSALFLPFKLATGDDIVAYYLFVVVLLALNAFGVYLLARYYVRGLYPAIFAGIAFSASNYLLGNIDSPHTSFVFVALLCLGLCKRYLETGERRALLLAGLVGGAQVYFSAYVFLFQCITATVLFLAHSFHGGDRRRLDPRTIAAAGLVSVVVATPFFGFYAAARASDEFVNPWELTFLAEVHSLEPADLFRTLENNLLYSFDQPILATDVSRRTQGMLDAGAIRLEGLTNDDARTVFGTLSTPDDVKYFVYTRRCAFLGFVLYALAAVGLVARRRFRWELLLIYFASLTLALGPMIELGDSLIPNLTYPAYRWLGIAGALRVPGRAFVFALLAVVLAAAAGLERLGASRWLDSPRRRAAAFGLLTLLVLVENVPVPLKSFAGAELATPESLVREFFAGQHGNVLLDLPSRPGGALYGDSGDLFEWNREIIYMNRQTYHRQNIVNGVHGYFPRSRLELQRLIDALPADEALDGLRDRGVDYLVYHRDLELDWEGGLLTGILRTGKVDVAATSRSVTILGWASGRPEGD